MPGRRTIRRDSELRPIPFARSYSQREWELIARGGEPYIVGEKWTIQADDSQLVVHRMGHCFYRVRSRPEGDRIVLDDAEALVESGADPALLDYQSRFLDFLLSAGSLAEEVDIPEWPLSEESVPRNSPPKSFITLLRQRLFRRRE